MLQRTVIRQHNQSFAILIEPSGSVYVFIINIIGQRRAAAPVGELA